MTPPATDPAHAGDLDRRDPLAPFRDRFVHADPGLVYLDGNSLGRLPSTTARRLAGAVDDEWGAGLVRSWDHWSDLPRRVGDLVGCGLLGAEPGEVALSDSTSVNLYKLAVAALDARPGRRAIVTDDDNFPTDRYVLEGIAARHGLELRVVATDIDEGIDPDAVAAAVDGDVALVCLSHVAYRSGALADLPTITSIAHRAGALVLWDLCHSAGAAPVGLSAAGVDLAVGCTYKYLNAGPGAPAFLYVNSRLQPALRQPIWGWFGQEDQFAMGPGYRPRAGVERFLVGSPAVMGLYAVEEGARLLVEAGVDRLRAKGVALTEYAVALSDAWLAGLGFTLASPRDPGRRGSHITLRHPEAYRISRALVETAGVIGDYRAPDRLRLGPAPIYTRFADVHRGLSRLRDVVAGGVHLRFDPTPRAVT